MIDDLRQSGSYRALFPRCGDMLQAIAINTAGGITGGDRLSLTGHVGEGAAMGLTTQAAERAYRSIDGAHGHVSSRLSVAEGATLYWLPQELILYDGCAMNRRLEIDLVASASLLMVEPVAFGRAAMGERLTHASFHDHICVRRAGRPLYRDGLRLDGDIASQMAQIPVGNCAGAMVSLLYVSPDAAAQISHLRHMLPETGGASLLAEDVLTVRLLAADSHEMRLHLLPVLDRLTRNTLPVSWRL